MSEELKYSNFKFVYSRPACNNVPECSVYECDSFEEEKRTWNIVKKYHITQPEDLDFVVSELQVLLSFQHENVLELKSYFPVPSLNEMWYVFKGSNAQFSRYGTLKIDQSNTDLNNAFIFDIVSALQYVVKSKHQLRTRVSQVQFFKFHNISSPFPTLKFLFEMEFSTNEKDANFNYTAPEALFGKTTDLSYLWGVGVIFSIV
ncbi:hypothetical protein EIN_164490, partial [Entamoeba invadens IP1]